MSTIGNIDVCEKPNYQLTLNVFVADFSDYLKTHSCKRFYEYYFFQFNILWAITE